MTREPITFKIQNLSYKDFTVVSGEPDLITLYPTHVEHKWKLTATVKGDDILVPETRSFIGISTIPKKHIQYTGAFYSHERKLYVVTIKSPVDEITQMLPTFKEASEIHRQILQWLYS